MAIQPKLRRGSEAGRLSQPLYETQLLYTTDRKELFVGDGSTNGGIQVSSVLKGDHKRRAVHANDLAGQTRYDATGGGSTNLPVSSYGTLITQGNSDYTSQMYLPHGDSQMFIRSEASNQISTDWREVITDNVLPVSNKGHWAHHDGNDYINVANHITNLNGTVDMTTQFQNLINDVNTGNFRSRTLFIPMSVSLRIGNVNVPKGINILGEGGHMGSQGSKLITTGDGLILNGEQRISCIELHRSGATPSSFSDRGITLNPSLDIDRVTIEDCLIVGFATGIHFNRGRKLNDSTIRNILGDNTVTVEVGKGIRVLLDNIKGFTYLGQERINGVGVYRGYLVKTYDCTYTNLSNLNSKGYQRGCFIQDSHSINISNMTYDTSSPESSTQGIELIGGLNLNINNLIVNNATHGVNALGHTGGMVTVASSYFSGCAQEGVHTAENILLTGCHFLNCGKAVHGNTSSFAVVVTGCQFTGCALGVEYVGTTPAVSKCTGNSFHNVGTPYAVGSVVVV